MNWTVLKEEPDGLACPWPERKKHVLLWHKFGFPALAIITEQGEWRVNGRGTSPRFLVASFTHWTYVTSPT